jgi:hypothetical protein
MITKSWEGGGACCWVVPSVPDASPLKPGEVVQPGNKKRTRHYSLNSSGDDSEDYAAATRDALPTELQLPCHRDADHPGCSRDADPDCSRDVDPDCSRDAELARTLSEYPLSQQQQAGVQKADHPGCSRDADPDWSRDADPDCSGDAELARTLSEYPPSQQQQAGVQEAVPMLLCWEWCLPPTATAAEMKEFVDQQVAREAKGYCKPADSESPATWGASSATEFRKLRREAAKQDGSPRAICAKVAD